jgi:hypothetical protein
MERSWKRELKFFHARGVDWQWDRKKMKKEERAKFLGEAKGRKNLTSPNLSQTLIFGI